MISTLELTILQGIVHNEEFTRKILPYVKEEYFESSVGRTLYSTFKDFFVQYDSRPTREAIAIQLEGIAGLNDSEFEELGHSAEAVFGEAQEQTLDFLTDATEKWCKERAVYLALLESISIHDGSGDKTRDAIPALLSEALAVSFDPHVGHDYLADYNERYDFYHIKEERTSFGLEYFDKITKGGLPDKTLNIALAGTGVGKSLFMCDFASKVLLQGKNVLYITLEMAEERIAERIDANLLNVNILDIIDVPRPIFEDKVTSIQKKTQGQLFIKEYPTASAHDVHFDALIKELQIKKGFKPDIVFIDYLNICASSLIVLVPTSTLICCQEHCRRAAWTGCQI